MVGVIIDYQIIDGLIFAIARGNCSSGHQGRREEKGGVYFGGSTAQFSSLR